MSSLRSIASQEADIIRDGIAWVVIWKEGRSWHSEAMWLNPDTDILEPEDLKKAREILDKDPNAIAVNGYYCGGFWEEMRVIDVERAIHRGYSENQNLLREWPELQETKNDGQEDAQVSGQQEGYEYTQKYGSPKKGAESYPAHIKAPLQRTRKKLLAGKELEIKMIEAGERSPPKSAKEQDA